MGKESYKDFFPRMPTYLSSGRRVRKVPCRQELLGARLGEELPCRRAGRALTGLCIGWGRKIVPELPSRALGLAPS